MTALWRHRQTRREISSIISAHAEFEKSGQDCSRLEERLVAAIGAEETARAAVLEHPVKNMQDVAAKAEYIHSLLLEGEGTFDGAELDMLLRSLIQTE